MPTGYAHVNKEYKAAPGPEARDIGYEYSADTNDQIVQLWRVTAADLVSKLEAQTGITPQTLYLETLPNNGAFNATYDEVLRAELRGRGYRLASSPGGTPHLRYEAFIADSKEIKLTTDAHPHFRHYDLVLTVLDSSVVNLKHDDESAILGQTYGTYELPTYGDRGAKLVFPLFTPVTGGAVE